MIAQNNEGILPVATLSIALYVLRRSMSINTPLPLKMYTTASERMANWVTSVSLLVEYLLYSVMIGFDIRSWVFY